VENNKIIFALGFFDGVHIGHQALLEQCRILALRSGCIPGAVTFDTHPDTLVQGNTPTLINTVEDRRRLLHSCGIDSVITLPFDEKMMTMPWKAFLEWLLEQDAAGFVCGDDFRFGHKGEGTAEKLCGFCADKGLPCAVVEEQTIDGVRVSSTYIRSLLEQGDVQTAAKFLGHAHTLTGEVVPGRQLGRTIGVPTANILIPDGVVTPRCGVYACNVHAEGHIYPAVTNIGSRPTVAGHQLRAESWILGFAGDLYGKQITLDFCKYLRPEQKFASLEELKAQIQRDAAEAFQLLR